MALLNAQPSIRATPAQTPRVALAARDRARRLLRWMVLTACTGLVALHATVSKEYQLKAAFLYNFTKFVEWQAAPAAPGAPITIGVLGANPFGDELARLVEGRKVNGREVNIRSVSATGELRGLSVLFIPAGEEADFAPLVGPLQEAGVLTVGESEHFAELGGTITFVPDAGKIRFEIDMDSARRSRVKVSAELQKLARNARRHAR